MKKLTTAIIAMFLVAMGAMFIFAQNSDGNADGGKRGFGKRGHHGKRFGGEGHGFMFRALNLTDEQKAQVKQIMESSKTTVQPLREQMKANRQKLAQLSENGNFDAAQVQAIAAQQGNLSAQLIVEKEKVKAQMFQILTDEQKAKAAEMKAQMKQRFEQRKQERMQKRAERNNQTDSVN